MLNWRTWNWGSIGEWVQGLSTAALAYAAYRLARRQTHLSVQPALHLSIVDTGAGYLLNIENVGQGVAQLLRLGEIQIAEKDFITRISFDEIAYLKPHEPRRFRHFVVESQTPSEKTDPFERAILKLQGWSLSVSFYDLLGTRYRQQYVISWYGGMTPGKRVVLGRWRRIGDKLYNKLRREPSSLPAEAWRRKGITVTQSRD